jgi:hypothetical protein
MTHASAQNSWPTSSASSPGGSTAAPSWFDAPQARALPHRRTDVVEQVMDGEAVLYDPVSRFTFRLNPTAAQVWRQCDGRSTVDDVVQQLCAQYEVDSDTALDDVLQMIALLATQGLVFARPAEAETTEDTAEDGR